MKPYLILTPGRTGSQFFARLVYQKQHLTNGIIFDPDVSLKLSLADFSVGHSLGIYDIPSLQEHYNIVLSYRENFVDTVLSRCIADQFEIWKPDSEKNKKPFTIRSDKIANVINQKTQWYLHYQKWLDMDSVDVVCYEILMSLARSNDWEFDDKPALIINYQASVDFIKQNISQQMQMALDDFCDCKARINKHRAYKLI